ncbi:MAG: type IV pilus assembly protein PilM [Bacteriovoracia bacterium]
MGLFGPSSHIGVSIGSSSIKVAEIKGGNSPSLLHFGVAQLPEDAIVNREIINHAGVVESLKGLVSELKIKGRSVVSSISGAAVIVKRILLEQTDPKELDDAVMWETEQYIPFDINDVVLDYEILNKNGPEGKMEIILVACKKATVESYQAVLKDAGLNIECMDVDVFGLQNIFEANYPSDTPVALIDIGATSMKVVIVANGQPVFTRDSAIGGRSLTSDIQKHLNLSYQEAEALKIDRNGGQLPQEVFDLMNVANENFAAEIKRTMDFFAASNAGVQVAYTLLCGGSAMIPNLTKVVEDNIGLPTQVLNPFNSITYDPKLFSPDYIQYISGIAAIPMGLALRGGAK